MTKTQPLKPTVDNGAVFPIVGIGASAGGLDAFKTFFSDMPPDAGLAYVLIQHLDPTHESLMVDLLSKCTTMPVMQAEDGLRVKPDHVYMIPPNRYLTLENGILRLLEFSERRGLRMAIDTFLRSLAKDQQECAVGVILTGTGTDGTAGLKEIKANGGLALVQDPATAAHDGMPRSAIATGVADLVCPIEQMAEVLIHYADHPYVNGNQQRQTGVGKTPDDLNAVLALLRARRGIDFRHYKSKTLERRIERRMGLNHLEKPRDYLALLRDHPEEVERLSKDLMIGVTGFFRDPEAFAELEKQVIAPLVRQADGNDPLRVWVPGCATGEEAYTLAMLLAEQLSAQNKSIVVQVFASDIDDDALETARAGRFPVGVAADLDPERLERHFEKNSDDRLTVKKALREMVIFAKQNLIADPPFSKLDLISCRNLMIYLQQPVQNQLIRLFHFALRPGGYLFLGGSESTGNHTDLFETVAKKWRLYRRLDGPSPQRLDLPVALADPAPPAVDRYNRSARRPRLAELAQRWVLDEYAPATVIVNRRFESLFFCGDTERYLKIPHGEPNLNLLDIARDGLVSRIRGAVHRALENNVPVDIERARMRQEGRYQPVGIRVKPLKGATGGGEGLAMVSFRELPIPEIHPAASEDGRGADEDALVHQLEDELKATKEDLQSTIEEMETSNEELKASNEEVMSMNEELQSTNEELETSKEELQSLNEELTTVNSQLQDKLAELELANNDVTNFLNSSELPILFLDTELRIKRFTPTTTRLFKMIPSDSGRPLVDIAQAFDDPDLLEDAKRVLDKLTPAERLIQDHAGRWYGRRVLPYRTQDNRIDGVVIVFNDITRLRRSERLASERLAQLESIYHQAPVGLSFHDRQLRMKRINERLAALNGAAVDDLRGKTPAEFLPPALAPKVEKIMRQVLESGEAATDIELHSELASQPGVVRDWLASYYPVYANSGELLGVNVMVLEITARKQAERRVAAGRAVAQVLAKARSFDTAIPQVLEAFAENFGANICEYWELHDDEKLRCSEFRVPGVSSEREDKLKQLFDEIVLKPGDSLIGQVWAERRPRWIEDVKSDPDFARSPEAAMLGLATGFAFPILSGEEAIGVMSFFTQDYLSLDTTMIEWMTALGRDIGNFARRIQAEAKLRADDQRKSEFLSVLGHELRNPLASINNAVRLLQQGTEEHDWALATMANNVVTMGRLLDDLLDLSRINSGKIVLRRQLIAVATLVDQSLSAVRGRLDDQHQQLTVELPPEPLTLDADPARLEQVLVNLLINASKFTPGGGEIRLSGARDNGRVVITVSDSGVGIDAESLTAIFEPFVQLDTARRPNSGLGIGLALVKQLTELHGGTVTARSDGPGQGASFTLCLPLAAARNQPSDPPRPATEPATGRADAGADPASKQRVLVVDDNETSTQGLAMVLNAWGYDVAIALDGTSALATAANHRPQALILDLSLPDIDGYELVPRLRQDGFGDALMIALSGLGDDAAKAKARAAGFDHHLNKPADLDALHRLLTQPESADWR